MGDSAQGRVRMRRGVVRLDDVQFNSGGGQVAGSVAFNIRDRLNLRIKAEATRWPIVLGAGATGSNGAAVAASSQPLDAQPPAGLATTRASTSAPVLRLLVDSRIRLDVDLAADPIEASGQVTLGAQVFSWGRDQGHLDLDSRMSGRTLHIESIQGTLAGGAVEGHATVPIDAVLKSQGQILWKDIALEPAAQSIEHLAGTAGHVDAKFTMSEATEPNPLGPLKFSLVVEGRDATIRHLDITRADLEGFIGARSEIFLERSSIQIADGEATIWLKTSDHGGQTYVHSKLTVSDLDLHALASALDPDAGEIQGRIGGWMTAVTYLSPPHRLAGQGELTLRDSELAGIDAFGLLFGALGIHGQKPRGEGRVRFTTEGARLLVDDLEYFNRPVDVRGEGILHDVWAGNDSPLDALLVGSLRPLKDSELELFNRLDAALNALQSEIAAVRVEGTLGQPRERVVPLRSIAGSIGRLLGGKRTKDQ